MSLYPHTIGRIRTLIRRRFFRIEAKTIDLASINIVEVIRDRDNIGETESPDFYRLCQYVLWMLDEIVKMQNPLKAARWMGWALAYMEVMGFISNEESRTMIRVDKERGDDGSGQNFEVTETDKGIDITLNNKEKLEISLEGGPGADNEWYQWLVVRLDGQVIARK